MKIKTNGYPDDNIRVACVCGNEVRIYDRVVDGRNRTDTVHFANHGQALLYADAVENGERRARDRYGS